ncbi:modification methylase SinI [Cylindrospermopsis raciborskii CS-508]|uniref:Cytosine-specific methyltransferase n=1 Tax=Cylindrospermopsis raciborskii C07 TaxID=2014886 RepID=A0ABX4WML0_9CYAN|nr:DNA cytosine methyltransferase [Cylindrospermopsis raciborskii]OHY31406.1 modification methylase SinI [Cylindrospermopsis raciborskii CS-508]PNJ90411.1 modification methylase SinI [Cylindrospermopsis raciborskii C03]PNJ94499.1 modification methylase SinI [Cylindrospermopsis raciborskii C04]PNJ95193.1 modification methylase SinI [Cylindrospermopsis raciborskii C07]
MIPEELLSIKTVSERLGLSEQRIRSLVRQGDINAVRVGHSWVIPREALNDYIENLEPEDHSRTIGEMPKIKALSFFSGAMGLDLGLEEAGIPMILACEIDKSCRKTIALNRPDLALLGNIWDYSASDVRNAAGLNDNDEIDIVVGGPPCQAFSTAGARRGFKDERGNALLKYVDLILELRPRYAVIENVRGLISAPLSHRPHADRGEDWKPGEGEQAGAALLHILSLLRGGGYGVSFNLYNAANFGVPQSRERVIIICHRGGNKVPHLMPTHSQDGSFGLPKWKTLRDALRGMDDVKHHHVDFPENRLKYYRLLSNGQYWKHLPIELQQEALGKSFFSGGGKTGFLRRLDWDKPSCTLVTSPNMPATDICHPTEDRPLSVEEYKRIQQFPDNWEFCGSLSDQYKQIGNAVPVGLGVAVGKAILSHMAGEDQHPPLGFSFSRYKATDEVEWEKQALSNVNFVKKQKKPVFEKTEIQIDLFADV